MFFAHCLFRNTIGNCNFMANGMLKCLIRLEKNIIGSRQNTCVSYYAVQQGYVVFYLLR